MALLLCATGGLPPVLHDRADRFQSMDKPPHRKQVQHFNVPGHIALLAYALVDKPPVAHKKDLSFITELSSHIPLMTAPNKTVTSTFDLPSQLPHAGSRIATEFDPSNGFHDIKALPEFHPFPNLLLPIAAFLFIVLGLILFLLKRRREKPSDHQPLPRTPDQRTLDEIEELEMLRLSQKVDLRVLSSRLSLAIRRYLEDTLSFPATDQTSEEVQKRLLRLFPKQLPLLPKQKHQELAELTYKLLSFCEILTFSEATETLYSLENKAVISALKEARSLVTEIAGYLLKEVERLTPVVTPRGTTTHKSLFLCLGLCPGLSLSLLGGRKKAKAKAKAKTLMSIEEKRHAP